MNERYKTTNVHNILRLVLFWCSAFLLWPLQKACVFYF